VEDLGGAGLSIPMGRKTVYTVIHHFQYTVYTSIHGVLLEWWRMRVHLLFERPSLI
jgi:hypothetical protein